MIKKRSYYEDTKLFNVYANNTVKCKCGHTVVMRPSTKKTLCSWCHNYIFRNKKDEDLYRLKEKIKNGNDYINVKRI